VADGRQRTLAARHVLAHHALDWAERHGAPGETPAPVRRQRLRRPGVTSIPGSA